MAREVPRTIQSLSTSIQRDIASAEYEVILIDNGSTEPPDVERCRRLIPSMEFHRIETTSRSPVGALNFGLSVARGELVGVFIDGARMATPRLLARAIQASSLHPRPVIGALSFHLGPKVQQISVREGYNQRVEDSLLLANRWTQDGYNLYLNCAPDPSSAKGWSFVPNETNSLFLRTEHWREIGGFDERFQTPGGGFVNLDIWRRLCADASNEIILLLGEATFHQLHGSATGSDTLPLFAAEYERLRGERYRSPEREPVLFGTLPPQSRPIMAHLAVLAVKHSPAVNQQR